MRYQSLKDGKQKHTQRYKATFTFVSVHRFVFSIGELFFIEEKHSLVKSIQKRLSRRKGDDEITDIDGRCGMSAYAKLKAAATEHMQSLQKSLERVKKFF